jgi:dTDP-4-dehydrorhamnose reductase
MVTGASGFVAGSVLTQADSGWEVHALSRSPGPAHGNNIQWHVCDPLVPNALARIFREIQPAAVIHTAALADIDFCQANQQLARNVNVDLTRNLAGLCSSKGARMIFCSTDTIFDGEHAPYKEEDVPRPVNFYAETKVEAEQAISQLGSQAVIARLSLVVGLPLLGAGNSFLVRMIDAFKAGRTVATTAREIRSPVDVITAGLALLELAASEQQGVFHIGGLSRVTRLELNQLIAERFQFPRRLVVEQPQSALPGRAPRPRDVSLATDKALAELKTPMRTLDEGLSLVLQNTHNLCL